MALHILMRFYWNKALFFFSFVLKSREKHDNAKPYCRLNPTLSQRKSIFRDVT